MAQPFDNPLGLDGFEFIEFVTHDPIGLATTFRGLGFTHVAHHNSKDMDLFRQGNINFIINNDKCSHSGYFYAEHGPGPCGFAFKVKNALRAYRRALEAGAQPVEVLTHPMEVKMPAIRAIGGATLYFIEDINADTEFYDINFRWLEGVEHHPTGYGFRQIDHITHNVYQGRIDYWARFYQRIFNFRELRSFNINGNYTALRSKAMTAPDGKIHIPLNEEADGGNGQINEYLKEFNGEGIQHIALLTDSLVQSLDKLLAAGIPMMTAPNESYYQMLESRLPEHGMAPEVLKSRGILVDGDTKGSVKRLLLQIFSNTLIGPVFFEFIERRGEHGFGEGNFKALFDSIERDQILRGLIQTQPERQHTVDGSNSGVEQKAESPRADDAER